MLRCPNFFAGGRRGPPLPASTNGIVLSLISFMKRCAESQRGTGGFICKVTLPGCPSFPQGEGPSKKEAKKNAAKHLVLHLLGQGGARPKTITPTIPGNVYASKHRLPPKFKKKI